MSLRCFSQLALVGTVSALLIGCASARSTGQTYSAAGQHEIAAQYYAHAFLESPDSEDVTAEFRTALDLAIRNLDADFEEASQAGTHRKAYAIAIRKAELMRWAHKLRLDGIDPESSAQLVEQTRAKATHEAVSLVDAAEQSNTNPKNLLRLLREAIALDPDNTEFNDRYARLKSRLERHITLSSKCTPAMQPICNAALRELTEKLTEVRRELFSVSTHQSDTASASLVLNLNVKTMNGNWQKIGSGNVTSNIKRLNDLKEKAKNSKGKQIYDQVKARYSAFKQTNKATVHASVRIKDLRPNKPDLYTGKITKSATNTSQYYDWVGDERAFTDHPNIAKLGTGRRPAVSTDLLTRQVWEKAISDLAKAIVAKLEN